MNDDFIKDKFVDECVKHGGEVRITLDFIECVIEDDYDDFIDFAKWMQKNMLDRKLDLRNEYSAEFDYRETEPYIFSSFTINRRGANLIVGSERHESAEGLVYSLEEEIKERMQNLRDEDSMIDIVDKAINKWKNRFPIGRNGVAIDLEFNNDYDTWDIRASTAEEIKSKNDDLNKIFDELEKKVLGEINDIPYPEI